MSWTLSISGAAIDKAGANASTAVTLSGAVLDRWSDMAEATLSTITRYDWVANYSSVKTNFKQILSDVVSDMVAMKIIAFDMSGYTSRMEATTMLDVLKDNITKNIEVLRDDKNKEGVML
jgi:hypothetical protein